MQDDVCCSVQGLRHGEARGGLVVMVEEMVEMVVELLLLLVVVLLEQRTH